MSLTARQLNRASLDRQLLLNRASLPLVDAVHQIVAIQAQSPASPYVALWNRMTAFEPADLDRAFADQGLVKATLVRITMHAVDRTDYPPFHEAMQRTLRSSCLGDTRFTAAGLSVEEADALVPDLVGFAARPRTNADFEAWLDERPGVRSGSAAWWALRRFAPLVHAATGGPWSFGYRPSYVAAPDLRRAGDVDASVQWLARRYLEGFGPASIQDVAQFALIPRSTARAALRAMAADLLELEGPDGAELFDVPEARVPAGDVPAPTRLMAMWDSVLLAYADRSRIIPPEYRQLVTRRNGDVLPTLLVDGYVAGVWRPVDGGIEATAFHRLTDDAWEGLETEARGLRALLADREPTVYSRYAHWWKTLPSAEVRVLGGSAG